MIGTGATLMAAIMLLTAQGTVPSRGAQRPSSAAQAQPAAPGKQPTSEVTELRKAVEALSAQVDLLRKDLARREMMDSVTVDRLQLLLLDERIARLRREIADLQRQSEGARAREDDLRRRMENIANELVIYGGLNREDSERAIRASLTRQIQDAQREQATLRRAQGALERDLAEAEQEAAALRRRVGGAVRARPVEAASDQGQPPAQPSGDDEPDSDVPPDDRR